MKLELFTLSDYAQEMQGKLIVVGTFDIIRTHNFPAHHPQCSIAIKIRFNKGDKLENAFKFCIIGKDPNKPVISIEGKFNSQNPENFETHSANIVLNLSNLNFEYEGTYQNQLYINGNKEGELPLYLKKI